MADTHSVMPKKLAQALIEAGVRHFDAGGMIGSGGMLGQQGYENAYSGRNMMPPPVAPIRGPATPSPYPGLSGSAGQNIGPAPIPGQAAPPRQTSNQMAQPSNMGSIYPSAPAPSGQVSTQVMPQGHQGIYDKSVLDQAGIDAGNALTQRFTGGALIGAHGLTGGDGWGGLMGGGGLLGGILGGGGVTNSFSATNPTITTQDFQPQITQQQQRQSDVYGQQQSLANALLAQSQGNGPGQQLIAQQTGQNVANQAALMASARGANSNPSLVARQAAMAGAQAQQQGLNANANLALQSQNALSNQQAQMANQALQGESVEQGGLAAQNSAITTGQLGAQNINANVAGQNSSTKGGLLGGIMGGIGGGLVGGLFAHGGEVKKMAVGGPVNDELGIAHYDTPGQTVGLNPMQGGGGGMGQGLGGVLNSGLGGMLSQDGGLFGMFGAGAAGGSGLMAGGAGDAIIEGTTMVAAKGGKVPFSQALLKGGRVPGKPQVKGDSEKNDTQPTLLSPGEVVLPRSVTQAKDPEAKAIEFLRHLKSVKKGSYKDVSDARVEKKACGGMIYGRK